MQKSVYRVRTQAHLATRIAIDMLPDAHAAGRAQRAQSLHYARDG
jgi:hypothetical protein